MRGRRIGWARSRRLWAAREPERRQEKAHHLLGWLQRGRKFNKRSDGRTYKLTQCAVKAPTGVVPSSSSTRPGAHPSIRVERIDRALSRWAPREGNGTSRYPPFWQGRPWRRGLAASHQPLGVTKLRCSPAWRHSPNMVAGGVGHRAQQRVLADHTSMSPRALG